MGGMTEGYAQGGLSGAFSSSGVQGGLMGLSTGLQTGAAINNARYNAASLRQQADSLVGVSNLQAYMTRQKYADDYRMLQLAQERQLSANRVDQVKHGISGGSANVVMQSYAAKGQKNLEALYYNAAMETGQQSIALSNQREALLERARQYDWKATQSAVAGALNFAGGALSLSAAQSKGEGIKPYAGLEGTSPANENYFGGGPDYMHQTYGSLSVNNSMTSTWGRPAAQAPKWSFNQG